MKKLSNLFFLFSLSLLLNIGCKKDNTTAPNEDCSTAGSLTCKIDGAVYKGKTFSNTMIIGKSLGVEAKRFDVNTLDSSGKQLILSISEQRDGTVGDGFNKNYENFVNYSKNYNDGTSFNGAFLTIVEGTKAAISSIYFDTGSIKITSSDATNKKMSGTFNGTLTANDGSVIEITEGVFTNVCYKVTRM